MKITVKSNWRPVGEVQMAEGRLRMPVLPDAPGVYQWVLRHEGRERRYVGEAANLAHRFEAYARSRPSAGTNQRVQERAVRVLAHDGSIQLLIATNVEIERAGRVEPADLSSKHVRCLIENATLIDVLVDLGELVNDIGYGTLTDDPVLG